MSEPLTGEHVAQVKAGLEVLRGHAAHATRDDIWDGVEPALIAIADLKRQLAEAQRLLRAVERAVVREGRNPGRAPQSSKGWRCGICQEWWSRRAEPEHGADCPLDRILKGGMNG